MPYSRSEVFKHIYGSEQRQELFIQYLIGHTALFLRRPGLPEAAGDPPATGFQHFAAGEALIHQGDDADHVFVIIEGSRRSLRTGRRSVTCRRTRFSAPWPCSPARAQCHGHRQRALHRDGDPQDQFLSLMQSNPRIAHSLIESMARRIDLMNKGK